MITPIYLGTVLLEKNRWTADKTPSFKVSEWSPRIAAAGFDGLELWENHIAAAAPAEQIALRSVRPRVAIFNTYVTFDDAGAAGRERAARLITDVRPDAVKFNFGNETSLVSRYVDNLRAWRARLPTGCRLLCECHGHTVLETPARAAEILRPLDFPVDIIVHAFGIDENELSAWCSFFGRSLTHIHAAWNVPGEGFKQLDGDAARNRARLEVLRTAGFTGTITVEFTAGVAQPDENIDRLLATATSDLLFLRHALA